MREGEVIYRLVAFSLAALLMSCQQSSQADNISGDTIKKIPAKVVSEVQRLAHEACICEQKSYFSGNKEINCWQKFKLKTKGILDVGTATSSAPISTSVPCFSGTEQCIVTEHVLMLEDEYIPICKNQHVEVIETEYRRAIDEKISKGSGINEADIFAQEQVRTIIELLEDGQPIGAEEN